MSSPTFLPLIVGLLAIAGAAYLAGGSARPSSASVAAQAATALSTDKCKEVDANDSFEVSIYIDNSPELFAFEIYFAYDSDLLEVVDRDVRIFLSDGPNSNVFDLSDAVPNSTGLYRLGAADVALGGTAETGDGTLATITMYARAEGVSPAAIFRPNNLPIGPSLTTVGGGMIGDTNGDQIFDGGITSGQIAIGVPCAAVAPTAKPDVGGTPAPTPTGGASTSQPTDSPSLTDGPTGGTAESPGATSSPSESPVDSGTPGANDGPSRSPVVSNNGGGEGPAGDIGSGADNTFWAIVLIGGGVGLGLLVTLVFARMTRKPA